MGYKVVFECLKYQGSLKAGFHCSTLIFFIFFVSQCYRVALNFCGNLILRIGDFLCFAGTNFCDWERLFFSCWELFFAICRKVRSIGITTFFFFFYWSTCSRNTGKTKWGLKHARSSMSPFMCHSVTHTSERKIRFFSKWAPTWFFVCVQFRQWSTLWWRKCLREFFYGNFFFLRIVKTHTVAARSAWS